MSLDKFVSVYSETRAEDNTHALEILRVELDSLWTQVKRSYTECRDEKMQSSDKPIDKTKLRDRYKKSLEVYKTCGASINAEIEALSCNKELVNRSERRSSCDTPPLDNNSVSYMRLPVCDVDPFYGEFTKWPTFRDLFTAICIRSDKMSNIEKLIYLTQKTGGAAREEIQNVPMTNEGFELAWTRLIKRYDNKRMQVNAQLKILFDLPNVSVDSADSVQKLQRAANGI